MSLRAKAEAGDLMFQSRASPTRFDPVRPECCCCPKGKEGEGGRKATSLALDWAGPRLDRTCFILKLLHFDTQDWLPLNDAPTSVNIKVECLGACDPNLIFYNCENIKDIRA